MAHGIVPFGYNERISLSQRIAEREVSEMDAHFGELLKST